MLIDVRSKEDDRLLFRYDPDTDIVEIKDNKGKEKVCLSKYKKRQYADIAEIVYGDPITNDT